jgi:predicted DNA binding protein
MEVTLEHETSVPLGRPVEYVWVRGPDREPAVAALADGPSSAVTILDRRADATLLRVASQEIDRPLFEVLDASDGCVLSAACASGEWTLGLQFPDSESVSAFYGACEDRDIDITVRNSGRFDAEGRHEAGALSEPQRETLKVALEAGCSEVPRRTTIRELAVSEMSNSSASPIRFTSRGTSK